MFELADWLSLALDEEDREIVRSFYRLRPEWLAFSDPSSFRLANFEPVCEGVERLEVDLEECCLFWGGWHEHYVGWAGTVQDAIDAVEAIFDERAVRVVELDRSGKVVGATLCRPETVDTCKLTVRYGIPATIDGEEPSSPRDVTYRTVTSWCGTYNRSVG